MHGHVTRNPVAARALPLAAVPVPGSTAQKGGAGTPGGVARPTERRFNDSVQVAIVTIENSLGAGDGVLGQRPLSVRLSGSSASMEVRSQPPGCPHMRLPWMAVGGVVALAALAVRPNINLAADELDLDADPEEVLSHLRCRLTGGDDLIAGDDRRVVRRFSGQAGRFTYSTVEIVGFEADAVTFDHLRGPFAACSERFELTATPTGSRLTHRGWFSLRGGLWTWPLAALLVTSAFEQHVRDHLAELQTELASTT